MSEAFTTPADDIMDGDVTGPLQPDPALLTEDECDELIDAVFGPDAEDAETDGE